MNLSFLNIIPFLLAICFMLPMAVRVPKAIRAWFAGGVMFALFLVFVGYFPQLQATQGALVETFEWVPELGINLTWYLDGLSLLFSMIVTGIGAVIFLYAGYYFDDDAEQIRFIAILSAFAGAMLGLVLAGNLITLFVMWELTSITSYLLIGFKGAKSEGARFGAAQAFLVTGVGALALIAGFVLIAFVTGQITGTNNLVFDLQTILNTDASAIGAHPLYLGILVLVALGAFTKSAQVPFHFWLPGAMEAPTPASAYLHSATMVKAGVYLLLRLYPVLHLGEMWTPLLVTVGMGTMFIGAFFALSQRDLKGLLAYSTISWLGALVAMIGLPEYEGFKAALVGIVAHALYKSALFLAAGTIDHSTGTRIIDKLGGLRQQMPMLAVVVGISALSMAGVPIFFGFVAKEVLLDAWVEAHFAGQDISYIFLLISAALTGTAALLFLWDVFFRPAKEAIDYHESHPVLIYAPLVLAIGSTVFGLLLDPPLAWIDDLIALGVPKPIDIHLLPSSFTNPVFLTSLGIIIAGAAIFMVRSFWLPVLQAIKIPKATTVFQGIIQGADQISDFVLRSQSGQVRYYLIVILGTVSAFILTSGIIGDLAQGQSIFDADVPFTAQMVLRVILFALAIVASVFTIIVRNHIHAALSLGVVGYAIGGVFLIEPAPDVSMVQFLMETLGTVLIFVMLGRIGERQRREAMGKLWEGKFKLGGLKIGIMRDLLIASAVGLSVFFFTLTALANRPERESITEYHLQNTYQDIGIEDVVGSIVADYRGMDTVIEVVVFSVAALGVLTLLSRGRESSNPFVPKREIVKVHGEFHPEALENVQEATNLNTPFTRLVARILMPLSFLLGLTHIVTGGHGPGDGFTAGAIAGLATALWFVVFGYQDTRARLGWFAPHRLMRAGLVIVVGNAIAPVIFGFGNGLFLTHLNYGKMLGIDGILHQFGLELSSGLFYEIGIALTVFGGISAIVESIAHPTEAPFTAFQADEEMEVTHG